MEALLNMLSPLSKLNMLKREIERQLKVKIKDFELIYHKKLSCLKFRIVDINLKKHIIDYEDSKNIESVIKMYLDTQNKTENTIDGFTVGIVDEKQLMIMYLSDHTKQIL